ncbi:MULTISPECIES: asparagine synthase (glutamine-hydrolyzing) [unclassified Nitratiruptor]|uniref:asparagine synthase (glutamine-hydrolyzing) n=1 Tax=unclassified Nitratiruptor TaxID=2624044 RepID=UPI0019156501|nr:MULTISPECIES: asparagine synthase (glutamine-hydrolyzing) [unclassified Nitratiruptor]BCD60948.1 asparagine synthase (glutamine-hydrolysing) [Nitratiruptor sp. YY08-10]BCD64880.1 asparagine synthase (glutamine-hydrolysing) [Nitratiruptor sp. YY08-14]
MCAIFGIVGSFNPLKAKKAFETLSHRGDDDIGYYEKKNLLLAHRRLYIVDKNAKQPYIHDGKVILFNGEIYNFHDLGAQSEAQAIAKSLQDFSQLQGMFALAVLDGEKLYLAKDPFGKKPLYYYVGHNFFIFASEIKAITAYLGSVGYNHKALSCYLSFGSIPNEHTFYKGIYKLLGGQELILDCQSRKFQIRKFTTLLQKRKAALEEVLLQSVQKRLQGDFKVASLLSGGVDSSFVSAVAKAMQGHLATYSIGYEEERYSELPYARVVASHIGSEHTEMVMTKEDFFETLHTVIEHFDEPVGDSASVPLFFLMERIKKDGFRVVLSGEGGDEIFLGYRQYFEMFDLYRAKDLKYKNWLKNYFRSHFSPNKEWEWYKRVFEDEVIFRSSCEVFTDLQKNLFMKRNVKDGESLECMDEILQQWWQSGWEDSFEFFTFVDLKIRLESLYLHKLDMVSMAHTIEARTPLLDRTILQAAFAHEERNKTSKYLLKEVAKSYIPQEIIQRKKKGFSYPYMQWMKQSELFEKIPKLNEQYDIFKKDQVEFLMENAKRNRFSRHFWLVFAHLLWLDENF